MKKVCFVSTVERAFKFFMLEHLRAMDGLYEVSVAVNTTDVDFLGPYGIKVAVHPVPIERRISPLRDLWALMMLFVLFRRGRFEIVHSIAPKSGLLAMVAALAAGVPYRVHVFVGQVWVTRRGPMRWLLKSMDRVLAACATHILVDSQSQRDFLIKEGIVSAVKSRVLANGSVSGADLKRFRADPAGRTEVRQSLGISERDIVFLFLGRLNFDKGVLDLAQSFARLCETHESVRLILVGPDEEGLRPTLLSMFGEHGGKVHVLEYTPVPERYVAASDVICLPSYREGFGVSIIEAAAAGLPAIATRIYGLTDAVVDGETGFLFEPGNSEALTGLMAHLADDADLRRMLGDKARRRTVQYFASDILVAAQLGFYDSLNSAR